MTWQGSLIPLFWILLLAFLFQMLTTKIPWLRIPTVIAYILLGMILGNGGASWLQPNEMQWLNGVSQFGLFYLMFLSGLEVDIKLLRLPPLRFQEGKRQAKNETLHQKIQPFNRLSNHSSNHSSNHHHSSRRTASSWSTSPLLLGLLMCACTAILAYVLSFFMAKMDPGLQPWMMMLILSTTSLGIVLPVLKEQGLLRSTYGQTLLTIALIADLVTMLAISVASDLYVNGFNWHQLSVGLLLPLVAFSYLFIARFRRTKLWERWLKPDSVGKLQAVLAILGLFGVCTDFTGSEPILGSFLAGILLSCFQLREDNKLRQQLEVVGYGLVIPIFFVMVGVHFRIEALLDSRQALAWIPLLLISAFAVKLLPMLWLGRPFGSREALAGGFLLSSRMTLVIVATSIGLQLKVIPRAIDQAMLVVAVLTCILSPILFLMIKPKATR